MLFLVAAAWSAEPIAYQCQAVWIGPREECSLEGSWTASGAGRSEKAARKDASDALVHAVTLAARAAGERTKGTMAAATTAPQMATCPRSAEETATVTCIRADGLAALQLCFTDLPEPVCEYTNQLTVEAVGYEAFGRGRKEMCAVLEKDLRARKSDAATIGDCLAACEQRVRVRCPGIPAKEP